MFKKILLAVDGSQESKKVIAWAKLARDEHPNAEMAFMYVHAPYVVSKAAGYMPVGAGIGRVETEIPEVSPAQAAAEAMGVEGVSYVNRLGFPLADVICGEAKQGEYDLIVVGSRGHGLVASVLLGSVSAKVLHHAPCAVLVVR